MSTAPKAWAPSFTVLLPLDLIINDKIITDYPVETDVLIWILSL